jgi:hypothetical protein
VVTLSTACTASCDTTSVLDSHAPATSVDGTCQCQLSAGQRGVIAEQGRTGGLLPTTTAASRSVASPACNSDAQRSNRTCESARFQAGDWSHRAVLPVLDATERCTNSSSHVMPAHCWVGTERAFQSQAPLLGYWVKRRTKNAQRHRQLSCHGRATYPAKQI